MDIFIPLGRGRYIFLIGTSVAFMPAGADLRYTPQVQRAHGRAKMARQRRHAAAVFGRGLRHLPSMSVTCAWLSARLTHISNPYGGLSKMV